MRTTRRSYWPASMQDENFPYPTVEALRRLGHNVLTVGEAGQAGLGIADEELLPSAPRRTAKPC